MATKTKAVAPEDHYYSVPGDPKKQAQNSAHGGGDDDDDMYEVPMEKEDETCVPSRFILSFLSARWLSCQYPRRCIYSALLCRCFAVLTPAHERPDDLMAEWLPMCWCAVA